MAIRAAQYVRMSTEHQRYSIDAQITANKAYAAEHGIEIVRTYADEGRSGLSIKGRDALSRLIADVQSKDTDYESLLVYDVSRWGRFQDTDESAYYEFICKLAGINVIYCAEPFANDGSMLATLMKAIKRVMAGEYSRELSVKVSRAHHQQAALGFHQGGPANFGLRRAIIDQHGQQKLVMNAHEAKYLSTDKVILVRGPQEEVEVIRDIFRLFNEERRSFGQIADFLNARGTRTARGMLWRKETISDVLRSEKYAGTFVFGMTKWPMRGPPIPVPRDKWIRVENAIPPVVDRKTFEKAQMLLKDGPNFSDNELLDYLSAAWCGLGLLSAPVLDDCAFAPTHQTYRERFGTLTNAYKLIGYKQIDTYRYTHAPVPIRVMHRRVIETFFSLRYAFNNPIGFDFDRQVLTIGKRSIVVAVLQYLPCRGRLPAGWALHLDNLPPCQQILIARMKEDNKGVLDYHLIPRDAFSCCQFRFTEANAGRFRKHKLACLSGIVRASRSRHARKILAPGRNRQAAQH